ncbi:MAG: GNAT family N-acetyltransferase [Candidatus Levybacteria bacterium]|nr:GNAT family N-acetyltransferase [Candidatus Levybacteria bacterium]
MSFRDITIEDYSMLVPFWKENYFVNEHDSFERFKLFLEKNPGLSLLAEDNGNIVGTVLGSYDGRRGYIQKLVVDKAHRRKGLGQELVRRVIKKLQTVGVTYIPITVEKNLLPFYEKCGFRVTEQIALNINI